MTTDPAIGFSQQTPCERVASPGGQGDAEIQPAEQTVVGNAGRAAAPGRLRPASSPAACRGTGPAPDRPRPGDECRCRRDHGRRAAPPGRRAVQPAQETAGRRLAHAAPNRSVSARARRGGPAPRPRRADCAAAGAAAPAAQPAADERPRSSRRRRRRPTPEPRATRVSSPRSPSVPSAMQRLAAISSTLSGVPMLPRRTRAARMRPPSSRSASPPPVQKRHRIRYRRHRGGADTSTRSARRARGRHLDRQPETGRAAAGRRSPSSGLPLPTSTKRAG